MILDTGFLIDLIQSDDRAMEKAEELEKSTEQLKISAATLFELYTGVVRSDKPEEEKEKVLEVIGSKPVVEGDASVMRRGGRIHGNLINKGERIEAFDCIIASAALNEGESVLTDNEKHFSKIDNLEVRTYR